MAFPVGFLIPRYRILLVLAFGLMTLVVFSLNHSPRIHPIFDAHRRQQTSSSVSPTNDDDQRRYEIKSCLSPDLQIHEKATCRFYALMIDAGSTGTRIHIFEFSHDTKNQAAPFKLEKETFAEVKPGLSSFTNNPPDAAISIQPLINKAKQTVPKNLWPHTPLSLKATAGVRLLNPVQAEILIDKVEEVLRSSPFLTNEDSASIMTGTDEGIFGWFTLNFLLDRLDALLLKPEELLTAVHDKLTAAALDLGGASTQVTFRPLREATKDEAPEDFIKDIRLFGQNVQLYTHSYLGNGLVAARLGSLKLSNFGARKNFSTACLPAEYKISWNYSEDWLSVRGGKTYGFDGCYNEYKSFIQSCNIDRPNELQSRDINAFGYYFDRAFQAKLVDQRGGYVTVSDLRNAAEKACQRFKFGKHHWEPWQCTDLTYIYSLLKDGYDLPNEKRIFITKKIRNMEMSWALGASYHLLNTYHESNNRAKLAASSAAADVVYNSSSSSRVLSPRFYYENFLSQFGVSFVCSRVFGSLTHILSYFQLLA